MRNKDWFTGMIKLAGLAKLANNKAFVALNMSVVFLILCTCFNVNANVSSKFLHAELKKNALTITATDQVVTLTAHSPFSIVAVHQELKHQQGDELFPSYALAEQNANTEKLAVNVEEFTDEIKFFTEEMSAVINKNDLSVTYYHGDKVIINNALSFFTPQAEQAKLGFRFGITDSEILLGGGERVLGMDRRGYRLPLYNKAHYGYTTESTQMYFGLPAIMSSNKYILLFDNGATGEMDLASTKANTIEFSAISGRASYAVVVGNDYPELINNFVNMTGKQPMPPRWALGNFASRFGYHTEQEVRDTAKAFVKEDMPLDAIVLDLYWFGKDIQGHMGNLAWDKNAFPTPEKMVSDLQASGVNTVLITEPFILSTSKNWQSATDANALALNSDGKPYQFDFYFGNTGLVDVFNQQGRDWFGQVYKDLYAQGVAGWWGDLGEPEVHPDDILHTLDNGKQVKGEEVHNVYGHQWAKMVFEQQQDYAPNTRPMIMMRSGFIGSQRYGMIPWTGDVSRSWGGLKPQVELSLQMGLLGFAYTHSDLGGFAGGETFDAELYTRWLQYGTFQPVYRPHAQENIAPEPVFHPAFVKDIVRDFIKLRYQLMPYNYTLAYENSTTGMPLMRPIFFTEPDNLSLYQEKNSYLWGDAFLVTPITEAGVSSVNVNLPKGKWFDFFTDNIIQGGQIISHTVDKKTIPVYVRAGSFIPMVETTTSTHQYQTDALTLHYYFDKSVNHSAGKMVEDDGKSLDSIEKQALDILQFSADFNDQALHLILMREGIGYENMPENRKITLVIHGWKTAPTAVTLGKKAIPIIHTKRAQKLAAESVLWQMEENTLTITFDWVGKQTLNLKVKS